MLPRGDWGGSYWKWPLKISHYAITRITVIPCYPCVGCGISLCLLVTQHNTYNLQPRCGKDMAKHVSWRVCLNGTGYPSLWANNLGCLFNNETLLLSLLLLLISSSILPIVFIIVLLISLLYRCRHLCNQCYQHQYMYNLQYSHNHSHRLYVNDHE